MKKPPFTIPEPEDEDPLRRLDDLYGLLGLQREEIDKRIQEVQDLIAKPGLRGGFEVDDVRSFGTIQNAVNAVPSTSSKTIYITNTQTVASNLTIPSNISLVVLKGGSFSIDSGVTLTINSPFKAGLFRVFTGAGTVTFNSNTYLEYVRPEWWGAIGDNSTDCATAINAACTAFPHVKLAKGQYNCLSAITTLQAGGSLFGVHKEKSILTVTTAQSANTGFAIINLTNPNNLTIKHVGFTGTTTNYPSDENLTIPKVITGVNATLSFPIISGIWMILTTSSDTETDGANIRIEDCDFKHLSNWGIRLRAGTGRDQWKGVHILNNTFYKASYGEKVLSVSGAGNSYSSTLGASMTFAKNIFVCGNRSVINSVQKYPKLGFSGMLASCDAIEINKCINFVCTDNMVEKSASGGIRIETCENGTISNNTVLESGNEGISTYNVCKKINIVGNTVKNWGRIPNFGNLREQGGVYYNCRETALSGTVNLPAAGDVATTAWFEANQYYLNGVSENSIPDYNASNYVNDGVAYSGDHTANPPTGFTTANSQGISPWRGFAAIAVTQLSEQILVSGNTIVGNKTQTSSKYNYASDYGISTIHNSNDPQDYKSPIILGPNFISGCIRAEVYQPGYCDPVNRRGTISGIKYYPGQVGLKSTSSANTDEPIELFPSLQENLIYSEEVPSLTFGTGAYYKMLGAGRPSIGTGAFGLFMHLRFTTALGSTLKYLFDAGVGGAATIGFRILVKASEINFSCTDGASNFEVKYQTVTDWGAGDNRTLLVYVCRDATTGLLRLNVNGVEKAAAGPSPIVNLDTGNDIGLGAASNGASEDLPFELFKCVLWSGTFTAQQIAERIYQKQLIRNGDTVLMNLDMRPCGSLLFDKASTSRVWVSSGSGVSVSHPYVLLPKPIHINTTAVGNVGAGEDDLMSYTVPARLLGTDGDTVRLKASGTFAANANNKRVRAYFGSDVLFDTTALAFNTGDWSLEIEITRTGATTQKAIAVWACGNTTVTAAPVDYTAPGRTLSSTNVFKLTGEATSNDDIQQQSARYFYEPA